LKTIPNMPEQVAPNRKDWVLLLQRRLSQKQRKFIQATT